MHKLLLQKKALDAVNEALLQPSDYPGADDSEFNPGFFKGSEPEQIKHAAQSPMQQQREKNMNSWQKDHPDFKKCPKCKGDGVQVSLRKRDYSQCSQCSGTGWKHSPAKQAEPKTAATYECADCGHRQQQNVDCQKCGNTCKFKEVQGKRSRFKGRSRRAEVELHEAPKFLPPRNELRSRLDEDLKEEIDEGKGEYKHFSRLLLPKK